MPGCPICSDSMDRLEMEYCRKGTLAVYQCAKCSGIWVDGDTVIRLTHASALKVDTVLEPKDMCTHPRRFSLTCPRCAKLLTESSRGKLPPGLHIDYCNTCYGLWFDKGELAAYKRGTAGSDRKNVLNKESVPLFNLLEAIADILSAVFFLG